jgi:hypothetical protein
MRFGGQLDAPPLWAIFGATVGLFLLGAETAFLLGRRIRRRSEEAQKGPVGEVVAALLGLLALLLAFTFSLAASRFDTRKGQVLEEANAIGTTWLRAGLLPEPHRAEIRRLLREYLEVRLAAVESGQLQQGIARSEQLQGRLWAEATAVGEQQPGSILVGLFIASLNEVIDLHAKRVIYGLQARIPAMIWAVLYFVALVSFGAIGYHAGLIGGRRFLVIWPLALTVSAVLFLIVDLDRPREGLFTVSQQALADLRKLMERPTGLLPPET